MANSQVIWKLLQAIVKGGTPEDVCRNQPELLAEVRRHWHRVRAVEQQIEVLFPSPDAIHEPGATDDQLPLIPGYEVQGVLGRGGMGVVYRAQHLALERPVALKMVLGGAYASATDRQRIHREAQAVAGLRHPNIVTVFDVGECEGKPFFTMELVEGRNLAERLAGRPQSAREAAVMVATLAEAVHAAHQAGIVHRDLKPSNVLITQEGTLKITDFGLARRFDGDMTLTLTLIRVGTPSYMAPEQVRGQPDSVGPSVDIYSLGALLYETLTGRPPFRAATALETQRQVIEDEAAAPSRLNSRIPRDLETICLKCIEKEPNRRYVSSAALAQDLLRFHRGEPISARRTGVGARIVKWARRRPAHTAAWVGGIAACGAILGAILWTVSIRAALAQAVSDDLVEVVRLEQASDWRAARNVLERAKTRLGPASGQDRLAMQISAVENELELVDRLAEVRFKHAASRDEVFDKAAWWSEYLALFAGAKLYTDNDTPEAFAARITRSPARVAFVAAMDDMFVCARNRVDLEWLLQVARLVDSEPWRDEARYRVALNDIEAMIALAHDAPVESQPTSLLLNVAGRLLDEAPAEAEALLRRVQAAHSSDFWANFALAESLGMWENAEAIAFYRAAIALRPQATAAHINLGIALARENRVDEAIDSLSRAVSMDPQSWVARIVLASLLLGEHRTEAALEHARVATQIDDPKQSFSHRLIGRALAQQGKFCEAADSFQCAVDLSSGDAQLRTFLSVAQRECDAERNGAPASQGS